jgi:hypothetical protein
MGMMVAAIIVLNLDFDSPNAGLIEVINNMAGNEQQARKNWSLERRVVVFYGRDNEVLEVLYKE